MASEAQVRDAQIKLTHKFKYIHLLQTALTAADSESPERDGNRRMAQLGDTLCRLMILMEGYHRGLSRSEQSKTLSTLSNKFARSFIAMEFGIDACIAISARQCNIGPQPTVLKNALSAIVAAVLIDSGDFRAVAQTMMDLGLIINTGLRTDPGEMDLPPAHEQQLGVISNDILSDEYTDASSWRQTMAEDGIDTQNPLLLELDQIMFGTEAAQASEFQIYDWTHIEDSSSLVELEAPVFPESGPSTITEPFPNTNNEHAAVRPLLSLETWSPSVLHTQSSASVGVVEENPTHLTQALPGSRLERHTSPIKHLGLTDECHNIIEKFVEEERRRADMWSLSTDSLLHWAERLASSILTLKTARQDILAKMASEIGSCNAFAGLCLVLDDFRSQQEGDIPTAGQELSVTERLDAIRTLDTRMVHLNQVRRFHVLKLYQDCLIDMDSDVTEDADGFIMISATTRSRDRKSTRGNPSHNRRANITKRMMIRAFPDLREGNKSYLASYRWLSSLRRVGRRLHTLCSHFSIGVLALLGNAFTDTRIAGLKDDVFKDFVALIERTDGDMIRTFSTAALPIVQCIIDGDHEHARFAIENDKVERIMSLPRGSNQLLQLLSEV